jgi:hypothetical protein
MLSAADVPLPTVLVSASLIATLRTTTVPDGRRASVSNTQEPGSVAAGPDRTVDTDLIDLADVREIDPEEVRDAEVADLPAELDEPIELDVTTEAPEADAAEQHRVVPLDDEDDYR